MSTILCFGDSLTWGYNPETNERFQYKERWTSLLEEKLKMNNKEYIVITEGLCGRTTIFPDPFLKDRESVVPLKLALESHDPDIVILMLGTNDLKSYVNGNPKEIALGCLKLIQIIKEHKSLSKKDPIGIILVIPPKIGEFISDAMINFFFDICHSSKDLATHYKNIAKLSCIKVINTNDFINLNSNNTDGIHLNKEQNVLLANRLYNEINKF